jgi:hypothetical protein
MRAQIYIFVFSSLIVFFSNFAFAEEKKDEKQTETVLKPAPPIVGVEFGLPGFYGATYTNVFADTAFSWTAGIFSISRNFGETSGGNSAGAQYYKEAFIEKGAAIVVRGAYDWSGGNMNDPGWYATAEVGVQRTRIDYTWGRYDDDPAVFRVGGDGLRLQESGGGDTNFTTAYIEPGLRFQFSRAQPKTWYFDLGISAQIFLSRPNFNFSNPAKGTTRNVQDSYPVGKLNLGILVPF